MKYNHYMGQTDYGPHPYVADVEKAAAQNRNFRTAIWTGCYLQMTLMCIPPCGEIGMEIHPDTDQLIRVEQGSARVEMGRCKSQLDFQQHLCRGDTVFVPAGTWHNIVNVERFPLKLSVVYAPTNHPRGTVQRMKPEAGMEEY